MDMAAPAEPCGAAPYASPMEIFNGKYYMQNNVLYLCTRDSGQALTHNLSELIDLYVIKANMD